MYTHKDWQEQKQEQEQEQEQEQQQRQQQETRQLINVPKEEKKNYTFEDWLTGTITITTITTTRDAMIDRRTKGEEEVHIVGKEGEGERDGVDGGIYWL